MDRAARAKQFMPFAALKGFEEALRAKEKIVVPKAELSEEIRAELDRIMQDLRKFDLAKVVYFSKGEYLEITGIVSKIDKDSRYITIVDTKIDFDDIYRMEILKHN